RDAGAIRHHRPGPQAPPEVDLLRPQARERPRHAPPGRVAPAPRTDALSGKSAAWRVAGRGGLTGGPSRWREALQAFGPRVRLSGQAEDLSTAPIATSRARRGSSRTTRTSTP